MSQALLDEFFERDLSDDELQALRDGLDSEDAALLFAEKARVFHQSLGVKRPGLWALFVRQASAWADSVLAARTPVLALGAAIFMVLAVLLYQATRARDIFVLEPNQGSVGSLASPGQAQASPSPIQRGHQLVIRLNLDRATVVEITVLTALGGKVCSLGGMPMDAGAHRLLWNGRTVSGVALPAGRYQVVTRWDGKEIVRWVELMPSSV